MKIYSVLDKEFAPYGKVLEGYDTAPLLKALDEETPLPEGVPFLLLKIPYFSDSSRIMPTAECLFR